MVSCPSTQLWPYHPSCTLFYSFKTPSPQNPEFSRKWWNPKLTTGLHLHPHLLFQRDHRSDSCFLQLPRALTTHRAGKHQPCCMGLLSLTAQPQHNQKEGDQPHFWERLTPTTAHIKRASQSQSMSRFNFPNQKNIVIFVSRQHGNSPGQPGL